MDTLKNATALLSQQIWCWGQDIKRPEGNWLLDSGFDRFTPPEDRIHCSSVYSLDLKGNRRIILRGFGVFFGDDARGGVFLDRYRFTPKYSESSSLKCPPWSDGDVPVMNIPSPSQRVDCLFLLLDLIGWIRQYEVDIIARLGIKYRQDSLSQWNNGKRVSIPAEEIAAGWRSLSFLVANDFDLLLSQHEYSTLDNNSPESAA